MIPFETARQIILDHLLHFGVEEVSLSDSLGRVLKENWFADRPMPPFDRVTMDGIAIDFASAKMEKPLKIEGVGAAGAPRQNLVDSKACLEIMTGAILPKGTDTVIRYEDVLLEDGYATIQAPFRQGQNIHRKGEDQKEGVLLLGENTVIGAAEIGVGATIGKAKVQVAKQPKILIISTGDELVDVDQTPLDYQIRKSNVFSIKAGLEKQGYKAELRHLSDDLSEVVIALKTALKAYDVLIFSGGVSKGKFDYIPEALAQCGVEKLFHRVAQRPGKPFWFGRSDEATVFALPGNPVSSFMCLHVYILDWLRQSQGLSILSLPKAALSQPVQFKPSLTYFLEVALSFSETGQLLATPMKGNGSGDLANLSRGKGFIQLPADRNEFAAGEVFPVIEY